LAPARSQNVPKETVFQKPVAFFPSNSCNSAGIWLEATVFSAKESHSADFSPDFLKGAEFLELEANTEYEPGTRIASVGNPLGFPFAVSISETAKSQFFKRIHPGGIFTKTDPRFQVQGLYSSDIIKYGDESKPEVFTKGDIIPGMSGGPLIRLEDRENVRPKLTGINCLSDPRGLEGEGKIAIGIPAKEISEFLEKHQNDNNS